MTLNPGNCFTVGTFNIYDDLNQPVSGYVTVNGLTSIDFMTGDLSLVGVHNLTVKTFVTESLEELNPMSLTLTVIDSCETT